jgi:RNA polymerase sigma factor (sigma-70 family)
MATTMPRSAALFDSSDTFALDWKGLYHKHGPRLRRIAERRVGTEHAEDVVQDAFMRAFRNRTSLDPSRPIGAWLSSITLCSSTDVLRRRSARPEVAGEVEEHEPATSGTVEDEFENAVRRMGIEAAFDSLNHRQRRVLTRLEVDGWSQEEVAAVERISTEAVKSLAARARRTFREAYSAFAENMGVFGGAVVGTAVLRLRTRIQRLQGLVGDHVGAITAAAATVTVVAIATVPSARPSPTSAVEPSSQTTTTAEADHARPSLGSDGQPSTGADKPVVATDAPLATDSAAASGEVTPSSAPGQEIKASADVSGDDETTELMVGVEKSNDTGTSSGSAWLGLECEAGYTATAMCVVLKSTPEE